LAYRILVVLSNRLRDPVPHRAYPGLTQSDLAAKVEKKISDEHDEHTLLI